MSLDDIINPVATISASTIAEEGFSVPLIYAHHTAFPDLVRSYKVASFSTAMVADGIPVGSAAYRAAVALAKQNPVGADFKLGKRSHADIRIVRLTPTAANLATYSVTIETPTGTIATATYTSDADGTLAEICTGLATKINEIVPSLATGASGTYVACTGAADLQYGYYLLTNNLVLTDESTVTGGAIAADLDAIKAYDNDWYGLHLASSAPAAIEDVADWCETNKSKLFVAQTHDMRVFDSITYATNIFQSIKEQGYVRTHVTYNSRAHTYYGGSWMGQLISYEPGRADWMFKGVVGAVPEKLTATQAAKIEAQNGSFYQDIYRGKAITGSAESGGTGIFLDLVQLSDWLKARATEAILVILTSAPKVPHTDAGGGNSIWGAYKQVIDRAITNEAVDGDPSTWSIFVPKRKDLTPTDRSNYRWPGTNFVVTPTGAVHSVGTLNITLNVA